MNEGSISVRARSAVLRTVRFLWNRFGPMFAAEIWKRRIQQHIDVIPNLNGQGRLSAKNSL